MHLKSLLLSFILFPIIAFSQNTVTLTASKSSMGENESMEIVATAESPAEKDIIIDFELSGTAKHSLDFTSNFLTRGEVTILGIGIGKGDNQFSSPQGIFVDGDGNVYVADDNNCRVQKWSSAATHATTVAGGNGAGSAKNQLSHPSDVFVDSIGNVYVSDYRNHRVQKWAPGATEGVTVAGGNGPGTSVNQLAFPSSIYVDKTGNIYIVEESNNRVLKWAPGASAGVVVAGGNGMGSGQNQFHYPRSVLVDVNGNIFVSDNMNNRIQKWEPGATSGYTVLGDNPGGASTTQLFYPYRMAFDGSGSILLADSRNQRIQKWSTGSSGAITVAGGTGGNGLGQFNQPTDVGVDKKGNLYVADNGNYRIQKFRFEPQIKINAGEKIGKLFIIGIDDKNYEGDEEITFNSFLITNGLLSSDAPITVKILENDTPSVVNVNDVKLPLNLISYPNPTTSVISINIPGTHTNATMIIRDIMGAIVYKKALGISNERKLETDISNLKNGIYTITIETNSERYMSKVVKM